MCPLTGRALPSAPAEMPACCFLLGLAGGLLWLPTHDPQTLCCCQGNGSAFLVHCFFFFLNWINWSNRRLSYPHCHAFYLSLIALFPCLPQSLYLQTIFVPGVSSCLSSTPSRNLLHKWSPVSLSSPLCSSLNSCLPTVCSLILWWKLCFFFVFYTPVFRRGA